MGRHGSEINVFEYTDYRRFLSHWYLSAKKTRRGFSYRAFAKKAGFHTSNFLMLVIQGKRNMTEESLKKMTVGLSLNKQEQEFFRNLVFFNQARTHEGKNFYYQQILQSKKFTQLKPIECQQYEYFSAWYHPVVRELVASEEFDGSPEWIAGKISPPITEAQASKSLEILEGLGFIEKTSPDRWRQTSTILSTGPELTSVIVHNYHKGLLDLTKEVMDELDMKDRDVSALTLGVRRDQMPQIRVKVREFRQEILKMVSGESKPEEVIQLNIQLFPVTKVSE